MNLYNDNLVPTLNAANNIFSKATTSLEDKCQAVFENTKKFFKENYFSIFCFAAAVAVGVTLAVPLALSSGSSLVIGALCGGIAGTIAFFAARLNDNIKAILQDTDKEIKEEFDNSGVPNSADFVSDYDEFLALGVPEYPFAGISCVQVDDQSDIS